MALNKEIWVNDIKEQLLPDNTFVTKGTDYSAFADNHQIHIPVEANLVEVQSDRTQFPASVTTSHDAEHEITMHHYTTSPVRIVNPADVELCYDKRRVITEKLAKSLNQRFAEDALFVLAGRTREIVPADPSTIKYLTDVALYFDEFDFPETDRYVLLSASAYNHLLKELSEVQTNAFLASADLKTGVIGNIFGLNIMKRSHVNDGAADVMGCFWHKRDYYFALGDIEIYTQENAPEYYGTVISASVRFGSEFLPPSNS
jgi:hypothetical protein